MRIKLDTPLLLQDIAKIIRGECNLHINVFIEYIATDSREIERNDLFIAIKGKRHNGESYIDEVIKSGGFTLSSIRHKSDIYHPDTITALGTLASFVNKNLPYILYRVGITGSVGKTTTKEFLKSILSQKYSVHASDKNFNNEIGLPISLLSSKNEHEVLLMELGMNHLGEIARLSKYLSPNIGIITNIGTAHIGYLGSREGIAKAKLEITEGMTDGILIIPYDEPLLVTQKRTLTFSTSNRDADCCLLENNDGELLFFYKNDLFCKFSFAIMESQYRYCLANALAAAVTMGLNEADVLKGISVITKDNIRQKIIELDNLFFYTDFYNASRESVLACIEAAKSIYPGKVKNLLLGDILELGNMSDEIHYEIGRSILRKDFNNLFLFGNKITAIREGAASVGFPLNKIHVNNDISSPLTTAQQIREHCKKSEMIFMKASRAIGLERVLECFK